MSHKATSWAWSLTIEPSAKKFVLVALADFADEASSCYPGQSTLAAMTGQSVESVRRHVKALEEDGWLTREQRRRADGSRTSDRYVLAVNLTGSTTGQSAPHLPVNLPEPTGQIDRARTGKKNQLEEPTSSAEAERSVDELFERWYALYPRKVSKGAARRAYRAAVKKVDPSTLMAALSEQLGELSMQNRPEGDFRPYPATWLNGEKWADVPTAGGEPKRDGNGRIREW